MATEHTTSTRRTLRLARWRLVFADARVENPSGAQDEQWRLVAALEHRRIPETRAFGRMSALASYSWLGFLFLCVLIGYGVVWHRGMTQDDYLFSLGTFMTFPARPIPELLRVTVFPYYERLEFLGQVLTIALTILNAVLLGAFVYRLSQSRPAAVIAGTLFLMPSVGNEAILWFAAMPLYLPTACLTLLFWMFYYQAASTPVRRTHYAKRALFCFAASLLMGEPYALGALGLLPFLSAWAWIQGQRDLRGQVALLVGTGTAGIVLLGLLFLMYSNSPRLLNDSERGILDLRLSGLAERANAYFQRLYWMVFQPNWGMLRFQDSLAAAALVVRQSGLAFALLVLSVASLMISVLLTPRKFLVSPSITLRSAILLILVGVFILVVMLLLPGILLNSQILQYRMLYLPYAGFAIVVGAVCALITRALPGTLTARVLMLAAGVWLMLHTLSTLGIAHAYFVRYEADELLLDDLTEVLKRGTLPEQVTIFPYDPDLDLPDIESRLDRRTISVFETPWSLQAILRDALSHESLVVQTGNRFGRLSYAFVDNDARTLVVNDNRYSVDEVVLFTIVEGRISLIHSLTVQNADGTEQTAVFPLVDTFDNDVPVVENVIYEANS